MRRLETLRLRLLPAGTRMADVPPDPRGLTYHEWIELECLEYRESRPPRGDEPVRAVSTARDSYGRRSLPSGSSLLWKDKVS
jgi:hypothetical protein